MKLGLGTVQFGLDYGISNNAGKTVQSEVRRILTAAYEAGVQILDTAQGYGDSEEVLGVSIPEKASFEIVSKTPVIKYSGSIESSEVRIIEDACLASLEKMKISCLYGLLVHNADDLLALGGQLLYQSLKELQQRGLIKKIGASVYTGDQIERLSAKYTLDIIQVPVNILDQRLIRSGQLSQLKQEGVEIHARSAFLQGLLLMEPGLLGDYFKPWQSLLQTYQDEIKNKGLTPLQAALGFVLSLKEIDIVLCGVNSVAQLQEILTIHQLRLPADLEPERFACDDPGLLNPALWPKK